MKALFIIIWFLPVLFMIHEFEEIIMINIWQKRNKQYIDHMKNQGKKAPFDFKGSTASFSIGILEEFLIIFVITILSYLFNNYMLWYGLFIAITFHFFVHIFLCIGFKKYVPGITTTLILTPIFCFMIYKLNVILQYSIVTSIFSILVVTALMLLNLYLIHKSVSKCAFLLNKYSNNEI